MIRKVAICDWDEGTLFIYPLENQFFLDALNKYFEHIVGVFIKLFVKFSNRSILRRSGIHQILTRYLKLHHN